MIEWKDIKKNPPSEMDEVLAKNKGGNIMIVGHCHPSSYEISNKMQYDCENTGWTLPKITHYILVSDLQKIPNEVDKTNNRKSTENWNAIISGLKVSGNTWDLKVAKKPKWWQIISLKIGAWFIKKVL